MLEGGGGADEGARGEGAQGEGAQGEGAQGDGGARDDVAGDGGEPGAGRRLDRRAFLRRTGLAALVLAVPASGYAGYRYPWWGSADAPAPVEGGRHFASRPDLRPPRVTVTRGSVPLGAGERVFLAAKGYARPGPGQEGCLIVDGAGEPVWFEPHDGTEVRMDLRAQTYRGRPVLTWWHGAVVAGHGQGAGTIVDSTYTTVAEVHAVGDERMDLHEFRLTGRGTALVTAYAPRRTDLTAVGGDADGWVYDGVVQELDVATGALVMQWRSLDHVPVTESRQDLGSDGTRSSPFDYFHVNSIAEDADGGLVVSARNTSAVYKVARDGSRVLWRIGGTGSDYAVAPQAAFSWQHCVTPQPDGTLSIFDNASADDAPYSSGLVVTVDHAARTVGLRTRFVHGAGLRCDNQGSMQVLADGGAFVGWGAQPFFSRFDAAGRLVWDARLPSSEQSYRAFLGEWTATPAAPPDIAVHPQDAGGAGVYASWNGATEVRSWRMLAGAAPDALGVVAEVPRAGFETFVVVAHPGPWYAAAAVDGAGRELRRSRAVTVTPRPGDG